jgi:hypothetical protein
VVDKFKRVISVFLNNAFVGEGSRFNFTGDVTVTAADGEFTVEVAPSATATLIDGDKGDIVVSGGGTVWTVDNNTISNAKLRDSSATSVIGRSAGTSGDPADISAGSDGDVLRRSGGTLGFGSIPESSVTGLVADLAAKVPTSRLINTTAPITGGGDLSADRTIALSTDSTLEVNAGNLRRAAITSDVSIPAGSNTATIANDAVTTVKVANDQITYAKMQNVTDNRVIGRAAGSAGDPQELTVGAPLTIGSGAIDFDETAVLGNNARVTVRKNTGADVGTRRRLNLIEGTNVTLTVADDAGNEEVDVTIAAAGGAAATVTTVELDFGSTPVTSKQFTVIDGTISGTSKVVIVQSGAAATGRQADENEMDPLGVSATPGTGQMTVMAHALRGSVIGKYKFNYMVG